MHGISTQHYRFCARLLQTQCGLRQNISRFIPLALALTLFNFMEINAMQQQAGGMQTTQACFDSFINQTVIGDRRFPTHAAQQSNRFHYLLLLTLMTAVKQTCDQVSSSFGLPFSFSPV